MIAPRDIVSRIITELQDVSRGVAAVLSAIDTERSAATSTPAPISITSGPATNQFPEIFVDVTGNEFEYNVIPVTKDTITQNYTVEILCALRSAEALCEAWISNYLEAVTRILLAANLADVTQITMIRHDIADMYDKAGNMTKIGAVVCEVRIR